MASPRHCRVERVDRQAPDVIEKILTSARTIAIVGLSPDPGRPSHRVARYLQRAGYPLIPVNPTVAEAPGERRYPDLRQLPRPADVVDLLRRSRRAGPMVDAA